MPLKSVQYWHHITYAAFIFWGQKFTSGNSRAWKIKKIQNSAAICVSISHDLKNYIALSDVDTVASCSSSYIQDNTDIHTTFISGLITWHWHQNVSKRFFSFQSDTLLWYAETPYGIYFPLYLISLKFPNSDIQMMFFRNTPCQSDLAVLKVPWKAFSWLNMLQQEFWWGLKKERKIQSQI